MSWNPTKAHEVFHVFLPISQQNRGKFKYICMHRLKIEILVFRNYSSVPNKRTGRLLILDMFFQPIRSY